MPNIPLEDLASAPSSSRAATSAPARAVAGGAKAAPRAHLVWRDPVTGADLELEIAATPELIQSLARAGFRPAASASEVEAA